MIIYLCAFKHQNYIEEAKLCIQSIIEKGNFNGKIYLFTDFNIHINGVTIINVDIESVQLSASYRLRLFEHTTLDIPENEVILYLDTDIIILNKIPDFNSITDKIYVYGYPERNQASSSFVGFITTNKRFTNHIAFCSGILLFRYNDKIKQLFDEAYHLYLSLIKTNKINSCWEQPALCYTLIKYNAYDMLLNSFVVEERNNNKHITENIIFNHFCGMRGDKRQLLMKKYL